MARRTSFIHFTTIPMEISGPWRVRFFFHYPPSISDGSLCILPGGITTGLICQKTGLRSLK